jgi:hypothetical protein
MTSGCLSKRKTKAAWKHLKRRRNKKTKKITSITIEGDRLRGRCFSSETLQKTPQFFAADTTTANINISTQNKTTKYSLFRYSKVDFTIYDDTCGTCYRLHNNEILFILIPREQSIRAVGHSTKNDIALMNKVINGSVKTKRGTYKLMVPTTDIGHRPTRGRHGVSLSRCLATDENLLYSIKHLCSRVEHAARSFIPYEHIERLSRVRDTVSPFNTILNETDGTNIGLSAAVSISKDYVSAAHTDKDFFYSITTVRSDVYSDGLDSVIDWNVYPNPPVAQHFLFPEYGVGVGLRPGDTFVFNPRYYHCSGHKLDAYSDLSFYLATFYVKTANIGANDNRIPLTNMQVDIINHYE